MVIQDSLLGYNSSLLLIAGLLLDLIVGEAPWLFIYFPHPIVLIGNMIAFFDRKWNNAKFNASKRCVGGLTVTATVVIAIIFGVIWHQLTVTIPYTWGIEVCLIGIFVSQRSLYQHVSIVAKCLANKDLSSARIAVSQICGRDTDKLGESEVVCAAIESCAENFNDGVIAPEFWYILFGLPGLLVYKVANTLDSMVGHKNPQYQEFGAIAARLDDVLNWIPSRLSGLLIVIAAAFVFKAHPVKALKVMLRDGGKHPSPNAGWTEAAMSGALSLALGGPHSYLGSKVNSAWMGVENRRKAKVYDIKRALRIFTFSCIANIVLILIVNLLSFFFLKERFLSYWIECLPYSDW